MNVCNYCGVELDIEMNYCPLCGHMSNTPVASSEKECIQGKTVDAGNESYNFSELTQSEKRKIVWELSSIILGSGILVSFIIDLFINKQISWSKYSITVGLFLFINITLILFLQKRIFILLSGSFIITSLLLLLLDWYNQNLYLGSKLGIPIIFFIYLVVFFLTVLIRKSKQKGVNVIAYFLMAAGVLSLCIESILSLLQFNQIKLQWSVIVFVSVLSVSGILLFIHYRLKKVTDLKKFFHI
jgi:hypothetical protein